MLLMCTCVACARLLVFILRTRWVALLTTSGHICSDLETLNEQNPLVVDQAYLEGKMALQ